MKSIVQKMYEVIESGVLSKGLTVLPDSGASTQAILDLEARIGRELSADHKDLLRQWNGAILDVVNLLGLGGASDSIETALTYVQLPPEAEKPVPFASDPSGFVYCETASGQVWDWDHDGGECEVVAVDIHEFFFGLVFGPRADDFIDKEWLGELVEAGVAATP